MVFNVIVNEGVSNILTSDIDRIRTVPLPNTDTPNVLWKTSLIQVKMSLSVEVLSLNVRGLCRFEKRKMVFNWIKKHTSQDSIVFLQETRSDESSESIWKSQWRGEIEFSHGVNDASGTLICFREGLEYKMLNKHNDKDGRFVIIRCMI